MEEERRQHIYELSESIKALKEELRDSKNEHKISNKELEAKIDLLRAEIKREIKELDSKVDDDINAHKTLYFNGFGPHKHVSDHHIIDDMVEDIKNNKRAIRGTAEKWLDRAAWAAITFIAMSTWGTIKDNIQNTGHNSVIEKKIEYKQPEVENKIDVRPH